MSLSVSPSYPPDGLSWDRHFDSEPFSQKEGSEAALDSVLGAVKLYNDLEYRKKSEDIRQRLSGMMPDDKDYKTLLDQFSAFNANISEQRLRLPALPQ
jgi:hypothetical protein